MLSEEFLNELVENFSNFFKEAYNQEIYPNQNIESCMALYNMCLSMNPDYVIDIGTNYGASTLSFAYALKVLNKSLSLLTTIDRDLKHWRNETPEFQHGLLKRAGLDIKQIDVIESDFLALEPSKLLKKDSKCLLFYDIHDSDVESYSDKFLLNWVPKLSNAIVAVHDCSCVKENFVLRIFEGYTMTKSEHFSGKIFAGFEECRRFIEWANEIKKEIFSIPKTSIIYFEFK